MRIWRVVWMRWGMLSELMNFFRACFRPRSNRYVHTGSDAGGRQDGLLWYKDSGQHLNGDFSMAVVQANNLLEDQSQIESGSLSLNETGPFGTFIGVYDGHGGPETSRYVNNHLFQHLKSKRLNFDGLLWFQVCIFIYLLFYSFWWVNLALRRGKREILIGDLHVILPWGYYCPKFDCLIFGCLENFVK